MKKKKRISYSKAELKKAILLKEILDKPIALRKEVKYGDKHNYCG